jgi:hypothetical protein
MRSRRSRRRSRRKRRGKTEKEDEKMGEGRGGEQKEELPIYRYRCTMPICFAL